MEYTREDLERHIKEEHKQSPFSEYLKEIVYGGNDGIVTTFAVVAGFAGAQGSNTVEIGVLAVLLFGLANLFADGASMGLGNFLAIRSEQDRYTKERKKEEHEIVHSTEMEKAETRQLLEDRGFSTEDADHLVAIYAKNPSYWADFMMRYELEMEDLTEENPALTATATFLSFIIFGFIPLIPYVFLSTVGDTFVLAAVFTGIALTLLGVLRWFITRESLVRSVGEIVLIGGVSAAIAYLVGTFFRM